MNRRLLDQTYVNRMAAAKFGWWNWHYNRKRLDFETDMQIGISRRMVSWRRAL